ncbi:MAG: CCA tRNA nucleotidyltransferase [Paracoccaceae bacterium]
MKIAGNWIDHPGTQAVCQTLEKAGYRALFVGGCVRNAVIGVPVADIDIATDAVPETVSDLARSAGFRVIPTGITHGTVTVIAEGHAHEVTTFRRDVETDGRHAVVAFSDRVEEDAARRDFTMNALYADRSGVVIDPLGGLPDLRMRRIRFIGAASDRIAEDHLRILRFFRFYAHFGDPSAGIDPDGLAACAEAADQIDTLSHERLGAEIQKLLAATNPAPAIASMAAAGVLSVALPGADPRGLAPLVHLEGARSPRWQRRLALLGGHDLPERLRLSRQEAAEIHHIRDNVGTNRSPAALGYLLGDAVATDVVLVRAALLEQPIPSDWEAEIARGALAECPVRAADLMAKLQGAALGARLQDVKNRWLASDLMLTKEQLLA